MDSLWRDLKYAARSLAASPGLALAVVLSIGVGVGVNTTVFAWIDSLVRNPFPGIPDGGHLIALNVADTEGRVEGMAPIAYPVITEWAGRTSAFSGVAAHAQATLGLRQVPSDAAQPVWVEIVDANFFATVGVGAARGRVFDSADESSNGSVVVVSHALWQRVLGADPGAVGRTLLFNGVPLIVIGIAPPRFGGVVTGLAFDAWVPLWQQPVLIPGSDWRRDRTARRLQAIARLRPGVEFSQARAQLNQVANDVSGSFGESPRTGAGARWIGDTQLGSLMGPLGAAMLAVTLIVLLTVCANVAGLLLARGAARQRQTAIQVAVGATRWQLVRQELVHGGVLGLLGGAVGVWVAAATKDSLTTFVPRVALPVSLEVDLNWRVLGFAISAAVMASLLFSVVPALRGSRPDVVNVLKSAAGTSVGRRSRLRQLLVTAQVMLALVALATAGLFLRSVTAAANTPLGFDDPRRVLLVATDASFTRLEGASLTAVLARALERVRALPGVRDASLASFVPLSFGGPPGMRVRIDGYVPAPNESMLVARASISEDYFATLGIPLIEGRDLTTLDNADGQRVAVVNQALVERYWPEGSGVGRRVDDGQGWITVVGVARDAAIDSLTGPPRPLIYVPIAQRPVNALTLHVSTAADPMTLVEPVRRALAESHADLPALDPGTLADHMRAATFVQSLGAVGFSVFGVVALLVAATGLFGVVAQHVAERRREIAVRVAVGAGPWNVARSVVMPALRLVALGIAAGAIVAVAAAGLVRSQLVGVPAVDGWSIAGASSALVVVAVLSCVYPAWRAVSIDIVSVIRGL